MADTGKDILKCRTETHSDVADTPAARAHQSAQTERRFGDLVLRRLRESKGELRLRNLQEEWVSTSGGLVYEISAEAVSTAEQ